MFVLGKPEARCFLCVPYVPLCTGGTASASLLLRGFAGAVLVVSGEVGMLSGGRARANPE